MANPTVETQPTSQVNQLLQTGAACLANGDFAKAESAFAQAFQIDSKNLSAAWGAATAMRQQGKHEQVVNMMQSLPPGQSTLPPQLCGLWASCQRALGLAGAAITILDQALAEHGDQAPLLMERARALSDQAQMDQALADADKALHHPQAPADWHVEMAQLEFRAGRPDAALRRLQQILDAAPDFLPAARAQARLLELSNRLPEGERAIASHLERFPGDSDLLLLQARCRRRAKHPRQALTLLGPLAETGTTSANEAEVWFERGQCHATLGEADRAFAAFAKANQHLQKGVSKSQGDEYLVSLEQIRNFSTRMLEQGAAVCPGTVSNEPVFLFGFPRSGTTLLDQVLDAHPQLTVMEERGALRSTTALLDEMSGEAWPQSVMKLKASWCDPLRQRYFAAANAAMENDIAGRVVDKLPLGASYLPLIHLLFPNAKVIFALRHPADVVLSGFMQNFNLNPAMQNFLNLQSAAQLYRQVMELWLTWRESGQLDYCEVRYEDVVTDLETQVRRLLGFLDLPFDERVLEFQAHSKQRKLIQTPSYSQVGQGLYQHAKERWRQYRPHLAPVFPVLEPVASRLGYDFE